MQTRRVSAMETIASTTIGFVVSLLACQFLAPMIGINLTMNQNWAWTGMMTVISFVRGYCVRRSFEWVHRTLNL